jgi:hypothetical protein
MLTKINRIKILLLLGLLGLFLEWGCVKRETFSTQLDEPLEFSTDTVFFDTVFVTIGSATYNFKVYNRNPEGVKVNIRLAGGENSKYRLNINGRATLNYEGVEIPANDSIYIFAEVTIDPNNELEPFAVLDSVIFETNNSFQSVKLLSLGQNINFFNNVLIENSMIWDNSKPILLFNDVLIGENATVNILPGTEIYCYNGARLLVNGTLIAAGQKDNPIVFSTHRKEASYENTPGQWFGIWFLSNSINNVMEHTTIQNSVVGARVDSLPNVGRFKLSLNKCIIRHVSSVGILGFSTSIFVENSLIHSCGQYGIVGNLGGDYFVNHCTIDNSLVLVPRQTPSVSFDNAVFTDASGKDYGFGLKAEVTNSIIYGNRENEIQLINDTKIPQSFDTLFNYNIIKHSSYRFNNTNFVNRNPEFVSFQNGDYYLQNNSVGIGNGIYNVAEDLENNTRRNPPNIGCYERN